MNSRHRIADTLRRFGAGQALETTVATAAVMAAAFERPGLALSKYLRHLEKLADEVAKYSRSDQGAAPVELIAEALAQVLCRRYGYGGADGVEADADAHDLASVIDGRSGSSDALAILHADIARRLGWTAEIISIPGRAVIRIEAFSERVVVDPAGGGGELSPQDLRAIAKAHGGVETELTPGSLAPLDDKTAVLRLLAARKSLLLRSKRLEDAGRVIEAALTIAPDQAVLWRERGLLNVRLDRVAEAVQALEEYLRLGDDEGARYRTTVLLQELRDRLG